MPSEDKIRQLIHIADESKGETGHPDRLNRAERKFFKKYPGRIKKAFKGSKPHIRANEIARKMKVFGLEEKDVETAHRFLIKG